MADTKISELTGSNSTAIRSHVVADNTGDNGAGETIGLSSNAFVVESGYHTFNSRPDPVMCWGYNVSTGGTPRAADIAVGHYIEADYDVAGTRYAEWYAAIRGASTDTHNRPIFFQWNRTTGALVDARVHAAGTNGATGFKVFRPTGSAGEDGTLLWTFARNSLTGVCDDTSANLILNLPGAGTRAGQVTLGYGSTANAWTLRPTSATTTEMDLNSGGSKVFFYATPGGGNAASAMGLGYTGGSGDALSNTQILAVDCNSGASSTIGGITIRGRATAMTGIPLNVMNSSNVSGFSVRAGATTLGSYNVVTGTYGTALVQGATDGFLYIPTIATGAPSGTPTTHTGSSPICFCAANNTMYVWNGSAWRAVATA